MAINDRKLLDAEIEEKGVIAAPDKLTGTPAQNKAIFDRLVSDKIQDKFNGLIDDLSASTGATEIGFASDDLTSTDVTSAIEEVNNKAVKAVMITEQELTEEEKTQARVNIGVSSGQVAVSSVNGKTGAVSISFGELDAHVTEITVPANGWSNDAPYVQTISNAGIIGAGVPLFGLKPPAGTSAADGAAMHEAFSCISLAVTSAGSITFTCYADKPTADIPIQIVE